MSDIPTRAISVRQPWAWFIVNGFKDIENRDWKDWNPGLKFRGPVLIHASGWWRAEEIADDLEYGARIMEDAVECCRLPALHELRAESGGIIGQATITDVVLQHASPWFFGRYGLVLKDQKPLPFQPMRGMLGFFAAEYDRAGVA